MSEAGAKDLEVELGSGQLLADIDTALTGKNVGEKADATVTMPPGHPLP